MILTVSMSCSGVDGDFGAALIPELQLQVSSFFLRTSGSSV